MSQSWKQKNCCDSRRASKVIGIKDSEGKRDKKWNNSNIFGDHIDFAIWNQFHTVEISLKTWLVYENGIVFVFYVFFPKSYDVSLTLFTLLLSLLWASNKTYSATVSASTRSIWLAGVYRRAKRLLHNAKQNVRIIERELLGNRVFPFLLGYMYVMYTFPSERGWHP